MGDAGGEGWVKAETVENDLGELHDRYSLPVVVHEKFAPVEMIDTPKGERFLILARI